MLRTGAPSKIGTVPKTDNSPPKFDVKKIYYNKKKFTELGTFTIKRYEDNLKLVQKLNKINRLQARIDCWNIEINNEKAKVLAKQRLFQETHRKSERRAIHLKNREIIKRLAAIKARPTLSIYGFQARKNCEQSRYPQFKKPFPNLRRRYTVDRDLYLTKTPRTKCFFDFKISDSEFSLGRIVIQLYNDIAPKICANFEAFCRTNKEGLTYKGTFFHAIISGYMCQGGDVVERSGWGEASIFDKSQKQEGNTLKHDSLGIVSTFNDVNQTFDSKFNISFKSLKYFDGKKIVFGKVIKGAKHLLLTKPGEFIIRKYFNFNYRNYITKHFLICQVDCFGTKSGFPQKKIVITNCGVLSQRDTRGELQD